MAEDKKEPVTIKKYANRRLYNTGTSTYVTLEDLAAMVKTGEDFIVFDAKTGEDITRSVLAQIIFEQENKEGQSLLPIAFLRQLIRFYGDSMQMLVPRFLEASIELAVEGAGKISRADGAGLRCRRIRAARGPGAAKHGNVRKDIRHVRAVCTRTIKADRQAARLRAARWTSSSDSSTRCRSGWISSAARNSGSFGYADAARSFSFRHGRSDVASPIKRTLQVVAAPACKQRGGVFILHPLRDALETEPLR